MSAEADKVNEVSPRYLEECFAGNRLYGDDFGLELLEEWFASESGAYQALGSGSVEAGDSGSYPYHAINRWHGYRHLETSDFKHVVCLGGGDAEEVTGAGIRAESTTVVEPLIPSIDTLNRDSGTPKINYVKALASGDLKIDDESVDLLTSFGTLHHIANVSHVLDEVARCLRPGGTMLIREPIVSMGDWTKPRAGLTSMERGIPLRLLLASIERAGLEVSRAAPCMFGPVVRAQGVVRRSLINHRTVVIFDSLLSRISRWNLHYRSSNVLQKIAPSNIAIVARKPL